MSHSSGILIRYRSNRWPRLPDETFELAHVRALDEGPISDFAAAVWGDTARQEMLDRWWIQSEFAVAKAAVTPDGKVAGICVGIPSEWELPGGTAKTISICGWFVAPQFAGRGLGKTLVQSFADEASCMNALSISEAAIRNFAKLGWTGPFRTHLRLLPFPALFRAASRERREFEIVSFTASAASIPDDLASALNSIDAAKPASQLRRRRRASDWRAHLSVRPHRRPRFHVIRSAGEPVGYFIIRGTDEEAGSLYRRMRLHYVSDLVLNSYDKDLLSFVFSSMARVAPPTSGALLLCTSSEMLATAARESRWLSDESPTVGTRLAAKAPLYMLGGDLVHFGGSDLHLTFADSDVDLNI